MPEKTVQKEPGKKPKPQQEVIVHVPLSRLHDFPNHPFKVRDDEAMLETAESIRQYGVLVPASVRPREDGGYEIVAGHRRKHGSELAELQNLPCIVREMDDDTATILMVDSNIQRENILPSERAQAYKKKLEAIIGQPVYSFAYPFGLFTARDEGICNRAGYETCASTYPGQVQTYAKRFSLYRFRPSYRTGNALDKWLDIAGPKK